MRLYLSSYRLGNHIEKLKELVGTGRRVAIIENAVDNFSAEAIQERKASTYDIFDTFSEIGFQPEALDLREYFGEPDKLALKLKDYDLVWAIGGNAFILRRAMQQSGFDEIIKTMLQNDEIAYGGWSAGICVLGSKLNGIELCDDPNIAPPGYDPEIVWEGVGILDFTIVPHYCSDHPEAEAIEKTVEYCKKNAQPYVTLRDGDILFTNGSDEPAVLNLEDGEPSQLNLNHSDRNKTLV